jgi:uncharacterized protein (DUF2249 family)
MQIDENSKISKIIDNNPAAIDAIVSISKHFEKLRIPILRKTLASRVTIKQAAKIGGVSVEDFFNKLTPLGYIVITNEKTKTEIVQPLDNNKKEDTFETGKIVDLDVREMLKQNKDPFNVIMSAIENLPLDSSLNIINTFEPIPLINILTKKGYTYKTVQKEKMLVYTYFKKLNSTINQKTSNENNSIEFTSEQLLEKYKTKIKEISVKHLEMPLPMVTILSELSSLPENHLLFVHHKKVPQFLFPELVERNFKWHIEEASENNVKIFIFKE